MVAKENGKADILKWLKRKFLWQKVGELYWEEKDKDFEVGLPLYCEAVKQADGSKKMQVVAWCEYINVKMEDILLSKDTVHSVKLVEAAKPVRDMPWAKDGYIWKVNVYDIQITISNDLFKKPTIVSATLRLIANETCQKVFSYMGIKADCPKAEGPIISRPE